MSYYRRKSFIKKKKKKIYLLLVSCLLTCFIIYIFMNTKVDNRQVYNENIEELIKQAENLSVENKDSTTYYISQEGTSQDGTDINNPMSLEVANSKTYKDNDRILFKCGEVFYGQIDFKVEVENDDSMIYIGNYGEGDLPVITGATILKQKGCWELLYDNIYRLDLSNLENFEGYTINKNNLLYNVGFLEDSEGNIYANRKKEVGELQDDFDFYCENKYLYIYSELNPDDKLENLKFVSRLNLINLYNNTIVTGLNIQYTGAHGISASGSNNNIYIYDCIIQKIGGSVLSSDTFSRYGNGIQFWNESNNTIVEKCIVKDVYDTGYTFQGNDVTSGFYNNICRNNIFINCSYTFEFSCRNSNYQTNCDVKQNIVSNNISINQGNGWGIKYRDSDDYIAEVVMWLIPSDSEIMIVNNKYFNSKRIIYSYNDIILDNSKVVMDENKYYINANTYMYADNKTIDLLKQNNKDVNSKYRVSTEKEVEQITNKKVLESDDYNQIKTYYENLEKEFAYTDNINKITEKYTEFEEKYTQQISNIEGLQEQINTIKENIQSTNISTDKEYIIQQLEQTYKIGTKLINNNCEDLENMLKSIEEIGKSYKEIINTENNTETEVDTSDIENQFIALNNLLEDNNDLDIEFVLELKSLLTEYYNNIQTTQGYEKEYNYISAKYLIEYANIILNNKITEYIENNPVTVSYSATSLTNQDVTVTLNIPQDVKITNNEGSNTYTFTENGTFTFEYERRGKKDSEIVSVNYIDKTSPEITNVENGEAYTQSVSPNVSDEHLDKVQLTFKGQVIEDYEIGDELTEEGEYKLTATDTAGNTSTVKFYIMKEDSTYKINSSYILNINPETTTKSFMENFTIIKGYKIKNEDTELGEEDKISTGDILEDEDGTKFILVVKGDLNRDGRLSLIDLSIGRKYLLGIIDIDEVQKLSSDMNTDEETSLMDLSIMRKTLIGILQ